MLKYTFGNILQALLSFSFLAVARPGEPGPQPGAGVAAYVLYIYIYYYYYY